jgi:phytoene synthase
MPLDLVANQLSDADRSLCDEAIFSGSKSFDAASRLLPREVRAASRALYAFCRASDDLVDEGQMGRASITNLRSRLNAIYDDGASLALPCDRAFATVVHAYGIPKAIPDALIDGFEWDEDGRAYQSLEDLLDYAARVASTVGVMMAIIMGCKDEHGFARAADLGLGMQLTNIARDIGEDAQNGRIYLPLDWLREVGVERSDLLAGTADAKAVGTLTARLLDAADTFYRKGLTGLGALPMSCRPAIKSAAFIYRDIGREIVVNNYDLTRRAHTSTVRKLALIARAASTPLQASRVNSSAPHDSTAFLVNSARTLMAKNEAKTETGFARLLELMMTAEERRFQASTSREQA